MDSASKLPPQRPIEYQKWLDSLGSAETGGWTAREEALVFAAFIAGWYLRTGENPDKPSST